MQTVQCEVTDTAELIKLLEKTNEVFGVIGPAKAKIKCVDLFVLHQNILDDLSFKTCDLNASDLQNIQTASFVKNRGTDVVEAFRVIKTYVGQIKLPY